MECGRVPALLRALGWRWTCHSKSGSAPSASSTGCGAARDLGETAEVGANRDVHRRRDVRREPRRIFDQGDDGIVVILEVEVSPEHADAAARAVAACPSGALRRVDA
jgi:hypothetical protein